MMHYKLGRNLQLPQICSIFISSLAGVSHGMLFCWTSPGIPSVIREESFGITLEEASYFTIISPIAMVLAAPLYTVSLSHLGRKKTLLVIAIPQLLSWITTWFADTIYLFYVARFLSGVGDSGVFTVVPLYIAEISEPRVRGTWGSLVVIAIALGKFLVNVIGAYTSIKVTAAVGGCIVLLYLLLASFLPESPYYLAAQNKNERAKISLRLLRWRYDTDEELMRIKADVERQLSERGTYKDLFTIQSNRNALIIAVGLRMAQQYSGSLAIESYTQYMFQQAGGSLSEEASTSILMLMFIPALTLFIFSSDRFGKRSLAIFSSLGTALVLTLETIYFALQQFSNIELSRFNWFPLTGMVCYVLTICSGLIFLPMLMQGELFSTSIKDKANGVVTVLSGFNIIVVPKLFQTLTYNFGIFTPFAFFSLCAFLSALFCYVYVIETKGKTLEQIQQQLKGNVNNIDNGVR